MASIYLVRHGQASFGTDNYDQLSPLGHQQAALAGEYLARNVPKLEKVYSGSMRRQRETAEGIIAAQTAMGLAKPELVVDGRFNELDIDAQIKHLLPAMADPEGELLALRAQSRTSSRIYQKLLKRVFLHWQTVDDVIQHLESWQSFASRVQQATREVMSNSTAGSNSVVVTSGGVIATISHQILGLPKEGAYPLFEALLNCSITQLLHDRQRVSVFTYNECSYLRVYEQMRRETGLVTFR